MHPFKDQPDRIINYIVLTHPEYCFNTVTTMILKVVLLKYPEFLATLAAFGSLLGSLSALGTLGSRT